MKKKTSKAKTLSKLKKPKRDRELPVTKRLLDLTKQEVMGEISTLRLETKAGFLKVDSRIDRLESRMDSFISRMDGFDSRMDSFDSRMDSFISRMDGFDSRMDRLESKIDDVKLELKLEIKTQISGLDTKITKMLIYLKNKMIAIGPR
ncbi:MAG: hypothetical protein H6623_00220 [Bdellovibrionaceae bacterium]|nr:hypothetical protein [Pseudobdellovibrionaceae bacterium]